MNICADCHVLCRDVCPKCGRSKHIRPTGSDETVLLMVLSPMQSLFVEPILDESGIPYSRPGTMTSILTTHWGNGFESNRYYVPLAAYEQAREFITDAFGDNEEIMRALHEFDLTEE